MRTKTMTVFSYSELSDRAKETARGNYLSRGYEYFWADENRATLNAFEKRFPVKIRNFSYGGDRGDGIDWEFTGDDNHAGLTGQRLATYLWNNHRHDLFKGKYFSTQMKPCKKDKEHPAGLTYKHRHSRIMLENSCVLTGYYMDDSILDPIYKFLEKPDARTYEELLGDCLNSWLSDCTKDVEYSQSEEAMAEHFAANEYEFDESGNIQ